MTSIQLGRWAVAGLVACSVALGGVLTGSLAWAQQTPAKGKSNSGGGNARRKAPPNARDPLAEQINRAGGSGAAAKEKAKEKEKEKAKDDGTPAKAGTYHFTLKIRAFDGQNLAASYYQPAKSDTNTPVVLLVHEKDRSGKDFEDSIADLKGLGLAEHFQENGYAVLQVDLRGYGANTRRAMGERDWFSMVDDLQAFYQFLVDRHNRGEINLAKLGVVALGEGANLVSAWAYQPGGAVSSEGRVTDLSGLALVSPMPNGSGYAFPNLMSALAPRIPVLLMVGERDNASHDTVKRVRGGVEKTRQNKVELFPSSLHGYKLLRLEPRATTVLSRFLDGTVKLRATEWEPRYNLTPVNYSDIQVVRHKRDKAQEKDAEKEKAKAKAEDAPKAKEKAEDAPKPKAEDPPKAPDPAKTEKTAK